MRRSRAQAFVLLLVAAVSAGCDSGTSSPGVEAGASRGVESRAVLDEMLAELAVVEDKVLGLASTFDSDLYAWRPGDGVRSSAEVFMHMNAMNHAFPIFVGHEAPARTGLSLENLGETAPAYEASLSAKQEIEPELAASFAHVRTAILATSATQLDEEVVVMGSPWTVRAFWMDHVGHLREHLGQLIAYSRTNGVAPPW